MWILTSLYIKTNTIAVKYVHGCMMYSWTESMQIIVKEAISILLADFNSRVALLGLIHLYAYGGVSMPMKSFIVLQSGYSIHAHNL